jgi:hypothetical protein
MLGSAMEVDGRDGEIDPLKQSDVELESFRWRVGKNHAAADETASGAALRRAIQLHLV